MIQTLVHTWRGRGCSILIEINFKTVKPIAPQSVQHARHIFSQAQLFQNIISESVCLLGTTAGVIRVNKGLVLGKQGTDFEHHAQRCSRDRWVICSILPLILTDYFMLLVHLTS